MKGGCPLGILEVSPGMDTKNSVEFLFETEYVAQAGLELAACLSHKHWSYRREPG